MSLNETIIETMNAITPSGTLWIVKVLAIFGLIFILQTLLKAGVDLVYLGAYIVGGIKWLLEKLKLKH